VQDNDDSGELTYRQTDVLGLLALGLTAEESAAVLGVSASTVEHERGKLRKRLGATTPPQVVAIAYETKLLPLKTERQERLAELIKKRF
jgi:DNA-binding CsgD family transcriptional regulator